MKLARPVIALLAAGAAAGATPACTPAGSSDAAAIESPQGLPEAGGAPSANDASIESATDAATPSLTITLFPRVGDPNDDVAPPSGPGLVLMGGGPDVDAAFAWSRSVIGPSAQARAGDVVVLRASGGDGYTSYLYDIASFRSVQTILVPDGAGPADLAAAADVVDRAELVFFAGGDQAKYVAWRSTPLAASVQGVYARGGVVGGTSAGCAILGAFGYDAVSTGNSNVTSTAAIADPFDPRISFTRHMFTFPALADAITDTHFFERDRMGRLVAFMARQLSDGAVVRQPAGVLGIGVDEGAAIVIDAQKQGHLLRQRPSARAFVVRGAASAAVMPGAPLAYGALRVFRFDDTSSGFDFGSWCGPVPSYVVALDGSKSTPFSPSSPYDASASIASCP